MKKGKALKETFLLFLFLSPLRASASAPSVVSEREEKKYSDMAVCDGKSKHFFLLFQPTTLPLFYMFAVFLKNIAQEER